MAHPLRSTGLILLLALVIPVAARAVPALPTRGLPAPAGRDSGEPNLAAGPDGTLYLTWSGPGDREGERAVRFATLAPGSGAWSQPRTIVSTGLLMENWADFASLVVATDGALWAQWFQRRAAGGRGYAGWCARSADGGETWSLPTPLGHEFVSLAPLRGGRVLAVWLESTRTAAPPDPAAPYAPAMKLMATVLAPDGSSGPPIVVDPDTCTCCQTTLTPLGGDRVLVAYRGHTRTEVRDHLVAIFDGAVWSPPRPLHADGWLIPACPVNGPAADTSARGTAVAWFTAADGIARVQAKLSPDRGATFGPARPVDLGRPIGRIDLVTLPDGSAVVSWLESPGGPGAGLYVRRLFPDGRQSPARILASTSADRASGFPRLARRAGGVGHPIVVTWTEVGAGGTEVRTAEFAAAALTREVASADPARTEVRSVALIRSEQIVIADWCGSPAATALHP